VIVVSDGTVALSQIRRRLCWWPARLETMEWERFRDFHKAKGRSELVEYANKDPFGRKLSAILAMSEETRLLWCDCDILFYSDFSGLIDIDSTQPLLLKTAKDW